MTRDVSRPSERSGAEHSRPIYRFKDCEIDPAAYRLLVRGDPVSIEPRVFELLVYLILNRERVVTKDELLNALWAGKYVSESTLTRAIHAARRATGDDSQRQEIIKTLHSRGYQFVAAVAKVEPDRAEAPDAVEPSAEHAPRSVTKGRLRSALHRHRRVLWGAVLSLAMLSVALFFVFSNRHLQPQRERLALAPFSVDPAAEDLGWGELALPGLVADELRDRAGVAVFSANRVRQALHQKGLDADSHPQEQVRVLRDVFGVDHVLFAHVGRDNAWLRIDYALVSADGRRFASTARAQGAGSLVSELASSIARQLDVAYNARIPSRKIGSDEFINESFARGLQALLAGRLEDAMRYFEACLAGDPDNGWAKYKLGNVLRLQGRWDEAEQLYYAAHEHGEQNGDPDLGAAASAGMGLLAWLQGRMDEAERHFESARERWATIGRRASLASVHGNLGVLADNRHDYSGAREQYERALTLYRSEGERAGKSAVYSNLAVIERKLGNMETAAELQQRAIDLQRQLGLDRMLVLSLAHLGGVRGVIAGCGARRRSYRAGGRALLAGGARERPRTS
jgi:DNA-binding winged helix-turn-helix (wHTH) protein/tetratricopeptide (TPR) repeat protein